MNTPQKTYDTADVELILEWVDKYFKVSELINQSFGGNDFETLSRMPFIENEIEYQHLRRWFFQHHDKFVGIWDDFCRSRGISNGIDSNTGELEYRENPFFYYYPENLQDIAYMLGARSSDDTGYLTAEDLGAGRVSESDVLAHSGKSGPLGRGICGG
jgi:hypothetical protein